MNKEKALLFIYEGFAEYEISAAISMLRDSHTVVTISVDKGAVVSEAGLTIIPDLTLNEAVLEDFELLIVPGGNLLPIENKPELYEWVRVFVSQSKAAAAICSGAYVLARAGLLEGIPYTVSLTKNQRNFLGFFQEENYQYNSVVRYGNILTAQGHAYVDFAIELKKMVSDASAEAVDFYRGTRNKMMEEV
ncbi:DJ-1/PfpI family protein [Peribacillus sp. SCS-155]|uniref:DJ-1/PfpI family protein n=1 Tax=Peribacillus sedimenti TaxID=3115297 RepID=UPI003905F44C